MSGFLRVCAFAVFIFILCANCGQQKEIKVASYVDQMGEIPYQSNLDDADFKLCDSTNIVHSRLSLSYDGGISTIERECINKFNQQPEFTSFTGFVMIRFLINCNFELDRFRVETMSLDFIPKACPEKLTKNLLSIVQSLDRWKRSSRYPEPIDCSKYLIFKIVDGNLESISQ